MFLNMLAAILLSDPAPTSDFDQFVETFRIDAVSAGISPATYDREMASATKLPIVVERNDNQPEFVRPVWSYLDSAVSERRIADGTTGMLNLAAPLKAASEKYGVDEAIIAAIWGLESHYGNILGNHDVISALATLAYDGRRQSFGRTQLIGALKIIDNGYATRDQLKGSWAGAMGQTQFIPTTYLQYAVDENGDGKRDLWSDADDVFGSTANYLAKSGYTLGQPWGFEVILPDGFDYASASRSFRRSAAEWSLAGVATPQGPLGEAVDLNEQASIILPAGGDGPAFMVFGNFRAILKYNNSTSYALGIGMLSEALSGTPMTLSRPWPTDDRPLTRSERKELQQALKDAGFDPGPVDGIIGGGTQSALRAWQRANDLRPDGYASAKTLDRLTAE